VLVADRDTDIRNVVEDLLLDYDFEVRQAANLDEAVRELRDGAIDVMLCHLELLRSGDGRLGRRAQELQPALRVVAMSAAGAQAESDEADANLAKPFTRSQLMAALRPG
jgi:DNA-binding NtrC family response regulator